ncbi:MAG TPA: peptidase S10 [Aliidongia sp.]|nr:peptidase S10 [Aliidongia sp.]
MLAQTEAAAPAPAEIPEPGRYVTNHRGTFNGRQIDYTAIGADLYLLDPAGKPRATIFSYSYLMDEPGDPSTRPVTFLFNGGPGSASLWVHMGAFGPKRVIVPGDGTAAGAGPYKVVHNPLCLLDATDLVFIDPIGTGYSRPLGETKAEDFFGVDADAEAIGEFITQWLTLHRRWASPRFMGGESYGTTRSVAVAGKLHGGLNGVAFNGLALISVILDFHTARFEKGNILPDVSYLPTYAVTALYHGRIKAPSDQAAFIDEVRHFAIEEYATALLAGSRLAPAKRRQVLRKLARYTGLSETWLDRTNLRIDPGRFRKELLRDKGVTVGRLDTRYLGQDFDDAGEMPDDDPAGHMIAGAYTGAVNDYLTRELKIDHGRPYQIFNRDALEKWKWHGAKKDGGPSWPGYVNVAPELGRLQRELPDMKVWMANGLYDLATAFFAVENTIANNGIDASRIAMTYYQSGHMMYVHEPSLESLLADFRTLLAS